MALRHGTWMDEESFKQPGRLVSRRRKRGVAPTSLSVAHGQQTSCCDRMQEGLCLDSIWVTNQFHGSEGDVWGWRWQESTPTASQLTKIGKMQSAERQLCRFEGPETRALTVWRLKHTVTSTVQAAKEWQQQLWLPTTKSKGTCIIACTLHQSQKASSSLSRLTKKVTRARCGDEKSF